MKFRRHMVPESHLYFLRSASYPYLVCLEMHADKLLDTVSQSCNAYQFMISDVSCADSFGTRNQKWTYCGSRNSKGRQAGLTLLVHEILFLQKQLTEMRYNQNGAHMTKFFMAALCMFVTK